MAESAVSFLLKKIVTLLEQEVTLLKGVRGQVRFIKDELESMRAFLRVADAKCEGDNELKAWVNQVRDVAYDTEDVLDKFLLRLGQHRGHGFFGFFSKIAHDIKTLKENHQITTEIQDIETRVKDISDRRQRYRHYSEEQGTSSAAISTWHDPRGDSLLLEEAEVIGIGKPRDELIGLLTKEESRLGVVAVVGRGGLGKTTLVKKVFDDPRVKTYFKYQAWITVSQTFNIEELLREMIHQLFKASMQEVPQRLDITKETDLKGILRNFLLLERYLVVLDDIWSINAWQDLKYALPDNKSGSQVMVTTRSTNIATKCCGHVYPLNPLGPEEAWALFCKKAFQSNPKHSCPPQLEKISQDFLRRCEGLPLAIVAIGGLLSTKDQTQMEWDIIHRTLDVEFDRAEELQNLKNILLLSYNDLPYFLKSCFLYLSIYPEDYSIERMRLIRSWVAEGFIEKRESMTLTAEEIAGGYLNELINRSLIQVAKVDNSGRVRRCQLHDLMRDLLVIKSREENFAKLVSEKSTSLDEKARRLSIHNKGENVLTDAGHSTLRSMFIFGLSNSSVLQTSFSGFRLLKVLDLEGAPVDRFPSEIVNMLHLKYLSLKRTKVEKLPKSLGRLRSLETLDLKWTHVSELPEEVNKLRQLRHLLVCCTNAEPDKSFDYVQGFRMLECIGGLTALQKLAVVDAGHCTGIIRELGKLTQLRRLAIRRLRREDGPELCASVTKMGHLLSFDVASINEDELLDLQSLSSPPQFLQRLYIKGRLEKLPNWCRSLTYLVKIRLTLSKMKVDPAKALHALNNLLVLQLDRAYDGEQLCFLAGGFQRLKIVWLMNLEGLKSVKGDEGALPHLQELYIKCCRALEKVPLGIEGLTNLKLIRFFQMPTVFLTSLMLDRWRVKHITDVSFRYVEDGHLEILRLDELVHSIDDANINSEVTHFDTLIKRRYGIDNVWMQQGE